MSAAAAPAAVAATTAAVSEAAPAIITYSASVQHFLLIGCLGMFLGAVFFLLLGARYNGNKIFHVISFFIAAISTCTYYAMWTGIGVYLKSTEDTPRLIFWARAIDNAFTIPLILLCLALIAKSNMSTIISLIGNGLLMIIVQLIGSFVLAPYKYIWWTAGVVFFAIVVVQLLIQLSDSQRVISPGAGDILKVLTVLICICWAIYPIVWVLGQEGNYTMHLSVQVGVLALVDWATKIGFGGFLLLQRESFEDVDGITETTKLRPTSELV